MLSRQYDVYFPEDAELTGVTIPHDDIKLPIQTPRQIEFPNWCKYHGKVFYDSGTEAGDDPEDPDFSLESGEWVVKCVTDHNNFVCMRLGQPHDERNNMDFDIGYVMRRIRKYEEE